MARTACLLLVAAAYLSGGCAAMVARSGRDLTGLKTREAIRAKLGEPCASGIGEGETFEEFRTHRKVAVYPIRYFGPGYAMLLALTWGTADLVLVPYELCLAGRKVLLGQTVRVTYDARGKVTAISCDGESVHSLPFRTIARDPAGEGTEAEGGPAPASSSSTGIALPHTSSAVGSRPLLRNSRISSSIQIVGRATSSHTLPSFSLPGGW